MKHTIFGILAFGIALTSRAYGVSLEEDLTLTSMQKRILDEFKVIVSPSLTHEYMKHDIYLIRWLRARDFNIDRARDMLMQNLEWRRKNNMDQIHLEDWSEYELKYQLNFDGIDKEGKPIAFLKLGTWDLRQATISGDRGKINRYIDKVMDYLMLKVFKLQTEGKNVTQFDFIADIAGFSISQQGCLPCLPIYVNFVASYESHFPGMADKIVLVNTPAVFEVVLSAIRPVMSPLTRNALKVFGTNKQHYGQNLFKDIDRNQLPPEVGGSDDGTVHVENYVD